ncbi:MAG: hypothetical protein ABL897_08405 [Hyphomicrobium sp.]
MTDDEYRAMGLKPPSEREPAPNAIKLRPLCVICDASYFEKHGITL